MITQMTIVSGDNAEYSGGQWPSGVKITVTRQQASSSPIRGYMDLQWNGHQLLGKHTIQYNVLNY